jgi:hypothetical protein
MTSLCDFFDGSKGMFDRPAFMRAAAVASSVEALPSTPVVDRESEVMDD